MSIDSARWSIGCDRCINSTSGRGLKTSRSPTRSRNGSIRNAIRETLPRHVPWPRADASDSSTTSRHPGSPGLSSLQREILAAIDLRATGADGQRRLERVAQ